MQVGIDEEKNVKQLDVYIVELKIHVQARQEALDFKIKNLDEKMTRNLVA